MPFANVNPKPDNLNLTLYKSLSLNQAVPQTITIKPKNQDGTPFDLTALTSVTVAIDNGVPFNGPGSGVQAVTATLLTHDATGATINLSSANLIGPLGSLVVGGKAQGRALISGTDGTTILILALGNAQFSEGV